MMYDPCDNCPVMIGSERCKGCRYDEDFWAMPTPRKEAES